MKVHPIDSALAGIQAATGPRAAAADGTDKVAAAATQPSAADAGAGSVRLSSRAEEAARIKELALAEPEVRMDVVRQARADLAAGRMTADPASLAAKIAADLF